MHSPNYLDVQNAFAELQKLTPKEKYKKIRSVAALAEKALKDASDVNELALYSTIFKSAGNSRLLNKAKTKEYELRGITDIKTLKTKLGTVNVESGLIAVGDPNTGYKAEYNLQKILGEMNDNHAFYCVGTGGDGTFDVTLRLVDINEPLLGAKEHKFILNTSSTATIKISSGYIKCADFWDISNSATAGVGYEIENGYYKVAFYLKDIKDKYFGFVVILTKTTNEAPNNLTELETVD